MHHLQKVKTLPVWALVNICTGMPLLMMDVMGANDARNRLVYAICRRAGGLPQAA